MRPDHVTLAATGPGAAALESSWAAAWAALATCVRPLGPGTGGARPVLTEGGPYPGAWLESTATISAEILARFAPDVARETHLLLAAGARPDGLLPYKVTDDGPAHRQVQRVTPLARGVWELYRRTGDRTYLATMYEALTADDAWMSAHRDTRGTGGVEAFCTFDTGHDASPRFWHVPDTTPGGDPARWDTANPRLPLLAPDLTAEAACRRRYLGLAAAELGHDPAPWAEAEARSLAALDACWDEADGLWYDVDATGAPVRVQSDVLLRVLACEVGSGALFRQALARYLLSTRKFFAAYPPTSLALDDPRFDHDAGRNSWGGPTNLLSLVRTPRAFEAHGHVVELGWVLRPAVGALVRAGRFPQTIHPWTGEPGYTDTYSPAALYLLDAVERLAGVLETPGGDVWCTATNLFDDPHGAPALAGVAYARRASGAHYAQTVSDGGAVVTRDGRPHVRFPAGWRVVLAPSGAVTSVVGMSATPVAGELALDGDATPGIDPAGRPASGSVRLTVAGNEVVSLEGGRVTGRGGPGVVAPTT